MSGVCKRVPVKKKKRLMISIEILCFFSLLTLKQVFRIWLNGHLVVKSDTFNLKQLLSNIDIGFN